MFRPGGVYEGAEGRRYLAIYNFQHDISTLLPKEFREAERVAAFSYSRGGKKGGVDVFLLNDKIPPITPIIKVKKTFSQGEEEYVIKHDDGRVAALPRDRIISATETYDVKASIVSSLPDPVKREALAFTLADIAYFCGEDTAKELRDGQRIQYVPRIIPVTEIRRIVPERMLTGGKAEFIPQCVLEANIDYTNGCLTSWIPGTEASFDGQFFKDWWQFIWGDCEYCYALKRHESFPKSIKEFDQTRLLEELKGEARLKFDSDEPHGKPIEILRFGKRTEPWTPFTENDFLQTLEAMTQTGTKGVITTKFLPYDPKFVDLLKKTRSTVLFSTGGPESVELGPKEWGRTNDFRIEQAIKYREQKVNAALFYLMNPIFPPTEDDRKRLETAEKHGVRVQFIPTRFYDRGAVQQMIAPLVGIESSKVSLWDVLRTTMDANQITFDKQEWFANTYEVAPGRILMPKLNRMDPFWAEKVARNVGHFRMCAHDSDKTYCGGCFTKPGTVSPTVHDAPETDIVKGTRKTKYSRNKDRERKKADKRQLPIFGKTKD